MPTAAISIHPLDGIPLVVEGDDLSGLLADALRESSIEPRDGDILVLAQKIVSKAEGRLVRLDDVTPSARALELAGAVQKDPRLVELILAESTGVVRSVPGLLIVEHRLGLVLANAGIDQSNIDHDSGDKALLLPVDPDASCAQIRAGLRSRIGVDLAVMIIDSIGRPWRMGTVGTALGLSGVAGLEDLRGRPDLLGRRLQATEVAVADEIAAAASLAMGQSDEGRPAVIVRGLHEARREGAAIELLRPKEADLFR